MSTTPQPEEQKLQDAMSDPNEIVYVTYTRLYATAHGLAFQTKTELFHQSNNDLIREIEADIPEKIKDSNGYSNETKLKEWQNGYNKCRSDVKQILTNAIKEGK